MLCGCEDSLYLAQKVLSMTKIEQRKNCGEKKEGPGEAICHNAVTFGDGLVQLILFSV